MAGFSMIEVLISLVIASFGLLGIAALFAKGIQYSNDSFSRNTAVQQAYNMADRIRANLAGRTAGAYDNVAAGPASTCACNGAACTPALLASYDICSWNNQNVGLLPSGGGTVTRDGVIYTITVSWDGSRSGTVDQTFTLRMEP
jgi:type IV pilus assembly protein PilV